MSNKTPNITIAPKKYLNVTLQHSKEAPTFLIPTFFYIPKHDVNLEIVGTSFGFLFLRWTLQFHLRHSAWTLYSAKIDLTRANQISNRLNQKDPSNAPVDAASILKAFERNVWLKEISSRKLELSHYGGRIIREVAREENFKKDISHIKTSSAETLKIDGLE